MKDLSQFEEKGREEKKRSSAEKKRSVAVGIALMTAKEKRGGTPS